MQATETLSVPAQGLVTTTLTYTYDSLYRLTEADYSSGENFQYQYDAAGNRTAYTATVGGAQVTTYTYDAANRLVKVGDVAYTWNALGQLTRDGTYTYTWDAAGRLITVTDGITTLGFLYDGDGNRLARVVNGTLTTHTLDVGLSLPEVLIEHDSGDVTRYLHLPTGFATDDGVWTYSAADGLGSVRQRLDASGHVAAVNDYRPFGAPLDGGGGDPYGYTGEWWEGDAGLLFLRARYYDPATGRFLSQDRFPGYTAIPGTLHPYLYGHNNPALYVDPSGNFGLLGAAIGVLGGGLVGGLIGGVSYALTTDDFSLGGLLGSAGKGALTGAAAGAVVGAFGPVAAPTLLGAVSQSAAIGATSSAVGAGVGYALDTLPNGRFSLGGLFTSMGLGGASGLVGGAFGGALGWSTNALLGKLMPHLGLTALPGWAGWSVAVGGGTLGGGIGGVATQAALNVLSCHDDSLWEAFQWGAFSGGVGAGLGHLAQSLQLRQQVNSLQELERFVETGEGDFNEILGHLKKVGVSLEENSPALEGWDAGGVYEWKLGEPGSLLWARGRTDLAQLRHEAAHYLQHRYMNFRLLESDLDVTLAELEAYWQELAHVEQFGGHNSFLEVERIELQIQNYTNKLYMLQGFTEAEVKQTLYDIERGR